VLKERNDLVEGIVWLARYNASFVDNSVIALTDRANEPCSPPSMAPSSGARTAEKLELEASRFGIATRSGNSTPRGEVFFVVGTLCRLMAVGPFEPTLDFLAADVARPRASGVDSSS